MTARGEPLPERGGVGALPTRRCGNGLRAGPLLATFVASPAGRSGGRPRPRHPRIAPMTPRRSTLVPLLLLAALLAPAAAGAQLIPGGGPGDMRDHRRGYLADVLRNVEGTVTAWRQARERKDAAASARFYADEAVFIPFRGALVTGNEDIRDALGRQFAVESEFRSAMQDFTAGGGLAYYAGEFSFRVQPPGESPYTASGTYVLVLERKDGGWKIRSHVERADPDVLEAQRLPAPAASAPAAADTTAEPAPAPAAETAPSPPAPRP